MGILQIHPATEDKTMAPRLTLAAATVACLFNASTALADDKANGEGIYLMGPGMPSVFTFDRNSMSCSVSWGTMGAPGPGPFTEPSMNVDQVNFGMIVFSVNVDQFDVADRRVKMTGAARSITTVNDKVVENALYRFTVEAVDGGPITDDSFSLTLHGANLMFDGHTFAPGSGSGIASGDIVIRP
jgi:hypothetical protein